MFVIVDRSFLSFFTFLVLINKVSMQSVWVINGTRGRTAILPCSTNKLNVNVYWRYNDSTTVCDIISSKLDFDEQYPAYSGRVDSFPDEIPKGNFSIKLHRLRMSDAGIYTCNIPNTATQGPVYLRVTATGNHKVSVSQEQYPEATVSSSPTVNCSRLSKHHLMNLQFCYDMQMVGSEFGINAKLNLSCFG
ncbi:uncharacterized protein LOC131347565 isoform X2 [Hemibagrus wyckioides]|uniref:uncharacterized protein LOC131347565 isoform X2 n=1 Tax=Hemibagrus wyckioides TaxID=337641 RepID=UPI00266CE719|nr:uncharacterized protein LOC131347565 isoform X2 [Hemibagrus wyckioides]